MRIRYYDRDKKEMVDLEPATKVMVVHIPPQDAQPALVVTVSTDVVLVNTSAGEKVARYEYTTLLSETGVEQEEELLVVKYECPKCGHKWEEEYTCACDSECPKCDTKNITALNWEKAGSE